MSIVFVGDSLSFAYPIFSVFVIIVVVAVVCDEGSAMHADFADKFYLISTY